MKKMNEKNLDLSQWKSSGPVAIAKVKARNAEMKAAKDAKFTARLSSADFEALKAAAEGEGMGYQTLLGSIVHKYVTGRLVDVNEAKKIAGIKPISTTRKSKAKAG